ncbi:MAG: tetratricopeptide repeat protein [Planctomycetota bacterium]|nr:tetratricopeptide repeat protein [Planctomycetota bacterium]
MRLCTLAGRSAILIGILAVLQAGVPSAHGQDYDDPAVLAEQTPRSEADQDRLHAVSLFAAARLAEQRQELPKALRGYQRAYRYDSKSLPTLREIIPLAFGLNREQEAIRYAVHLAELDGTEPAMLRRLGVVLIGQRDYQGALALFEKSIKNEPAEQKNATGVMLRLEMGRLYVLTKDFAKAGDMFQYVIHALDNASDYGLNPTLVKTMVGDKGETYELMAVAFLEAGRMKEAEVAYQRLAKLTPSKAVEAYHAAKVYFYEKKPQEAVEKLQLYLNSGETSKSNAPYELLGELLKELKLEDTLLERLQSLRNAQTGPNAPLDFQIAEALFAQKKFDEAQPLYQAVLKNAPSAQAYSRLVELYIETKQDEALIQLLGEIVTKSGSLDIASSSVKSLTADTNRFNQLLQIVRDKFSEPNEKNYGALRAIGWLACTANNFDAAGFFLDTAIRAQPKDRAEILLTWGLQQFVAERYADARRTFQRAIDEKALPVSNPTFYFYLAGALALEEKADDALAVAKVAAQKGPKNPRFESRIAWVLYQSKRYAAAADQYEALIKKYDEDHSSPEIRGVLREARLILSNIAVLQNQNEAAEEWIAQVLDEFPDDVGAMNDLGYLWADSNRHLLRAEKMIRRALKDEPESAAYLDSLGWVLYRQGRFSEALIEQQKAVALRQNEKEADGVMLDHLGDIHHKLQQLDHARMAWHSAAEAFKKAGDNDKLKAVQNKLEAK